MRSAFIRKWRHRLDFLRLETAAHARTLAALCAALYGLPRCGAPGLVLLSRPAAAAYLRRFGRLGGLPAVEIRLVVDRTELETALTGQAALGWPRSVIVSSELYQRFHTVLAADAAAGRIIVA
jgi:hypothetical protein